MPTPFSSHFRLFFDRASWKYFEAQLESNDNMIIISDLRKHSMAIMDGHCFC